MTFRSKVIALEAKAEKKDDKPKEKPVVVIIKEEPKFLKDPNCKEPAREFYKAIKKKLTDKGYRVETDAGESGSFPNGNAIAWIGHGRGANRLKFAPYNVKQIEVKGKSADRAAPEHFELSKSDLTAIDKLPSVK